MPSRHPIRSVTTALGALALLATAIAPAPAASAADATATLSGTVRSSDGSLFHYATIIVRSNGTGVASGQSYNGTYEITGLEPGDYEILASPAVHPVDDIGEWGDGTHGPSQQTLTTIAPGENTLDFDLDRGGRITGTVTASGAPLGARITLHTLDPVLPGPVRGVGAVDGTITSDPLPPGRYALMIDGKAAGWWVAEDHNGVQTDEPTDPPLTIGLGETIRIDADLTPAGRITGVVTLRHPDGSVTPVDHAAVRLTNIDTGTSTTVWTGADGGYRIQGLAGRFRVSFDKDLGSNEETLPEYLGGARVAEESDILDVEPLQILDGVDAELDLGGHIQISPEYSPAPSSPLSGHAGSTSREIWRWDAESGRYVRLSTGWVFPIPAGRAISGVLEPGTYVVVMDDGGSMQLPDGTGAEWVQYRGKTDPLTVAAGETTVDESLTLTTRFFDLERTAGIDRYETSAALSADTFEPGVPVAYLADGTTFPDALSGAAAAGTLGGPVLLTRGHALPAAIESELSRLRPQTIVVLGSEKSISADVHDDLAVLLGWHLLVDTRAN